MPGKYIVELEITDQGESYPANFNFSINDNGTISKGTIDYPTFGCNAKIVNNKPFKNSLTFSEKMSFGNDICTSSTYTITAIKTNFFSPYKNYIKFYSEYDGVPLEIKTLKYKYSPTSYAKMRLKYKIMHRNEILNSSNSSIIRKYIFLTKSNQFKNEAKKRLNALINIENKEFNKIEKSIEIKDFENYIVLYPGSKKILNAKKRISKIKRDKKIASLREQNSINGYYEAFKLSNEEKDIKNLLALVNNLTDLKKTLEEKTSLISHALVIEKLIYYYRKENTIDGYYEAYMLSKNDEDIKSLLSTINNLIKLETTVNKKPMIRSHPLVVKKLIYYYRNENSINGYNQAYDLSNNQSDMKASLDLSNSYKELELFIEKYKNSNYPDTLLVGKKRLLKVYRKTGRFEDFIKAYNLFNELTDLKKAFKKARTPTEKAKIEQLAFSRIKTKAGLFKINLSLNEPIFTGQNTSGGFTSQSSQYGYMKTRGSILIELSESLPYIPKYGTYSITVKLRQVVPLKRELRSNILGKSDKKYNETKEIFVTTFLSPPYNSETRKFNFDEIKIAYFNRGMMGGFTAEYPDHSPYLEVVDIIVDYKQNDIPENYKLNIDFDKIEKYNKNTFFPRKVVKNAYEKGVSLINNYANNEIGSYKNYSSSTTSTLSNGDNTSPSSSNSSTSSDNESYRCKHISNKTYRDLCRAIPRKDTSICQYLGEYSSYCRAMITKSDSYCSSGYMGNQEMRGLCRAHITNNQSYCKEIREGTDLKKFCKKQCYYISNSNMKEMCRALYK